MAKCDPIWTIYHDVWLWLVFRDGRSCVFKKNTTKHISDREQVLYGWPLLEVIWMYVLLKQIYLTCTLHIIYFVFSPLLMILLQSDKIVLPCVWIFFCWSVLVIYIWHACRISLLHVITQTQIWCLLFNLHLSSVLRWLPMKQIWPHTQRNGFRKWLWEEQIHGWA